VRCASLTIKCSFIRTQRTRALLPAVWEECAVVNDIELTDRLEWTWSINSSNYVRLDRTRVIDQLPCFIEWWPSAGARPAKVGRLPPEHLPPDGPKPDPSRGQTAHHGMQPIKSVTKGSPYSITERRVPELIPVLGSHLQVTWIIKPTLGCHYFRQACSYPRNS